MRIAILTLPLHFNYGGILQAYALQTVLQRMGHEALLIEKQRMPLRLPLYKAPFSYGKRILKNLAGQNVPIFLEQKINREDKAVTQYTSQFIAKYIKRRIVNDFNEINENDFDAFIVGSDQIWRPRYFRNIGVAYLNFTKDWDVKRMAYAASFGTDKWSYTNKQTKLCESLIKKFDGVSVREDTGVELCHNYYHINAQLVLDPTLLLHRNDYINLIKSAETPKSKGTLFTYILDETPEKATLIKRIAQERNLVPFRGNSKAENMLAPKEARIQPPVEQWLRGIYDAKFVVTDSFHACVFSMLFKKPFIVIGNKERGLSRFTSLLVQFEMGNHLLQEISAYSPQCSYDLEEGFEQRLKELRNASLQFITSKLS